MDLRVSCLWLLAGPRRAGKTSFCRLLASTARLAGWEVVGLLSPAIFDDGVKTGILVEDLQTGKTRPLARAGLASDLPPATFDLRLGDWYFDRAALDWGDRILETSLPCDLLIVDELGPLELLRGEGWVSALEVLCQPQYRLGLVVVRPELEGIAARLLPIQGTIRPDPSLTPEADVRRWWERLTHADPACQSLPRHPVRR